MSRAPATTSSLKYNDIFAFLRRRSDRRFAPNIIANTKSGAHQRKAFGLQFEFFAISGEWWAGCRHEALVCVAFVCRNVARRYCKRSRPVKTISLSSLGVGTAVRGANSIFRSTAISMIFVVRQSCGRSCPASFRSRQPDAGRVPRPPSGPCCDER